jgi:hypothetical protein
MRMGILYFRLGDWLHSSGMEPRTCRPVGRGGPRGLPSGLLGMSAAGHAAGAALAPGREAARGATSPPQKQTWPARAPTCTNDA